MKINKGSKGRGAFSTYILPVMVLIVGLVLTHFFYVYAEDSLRRSNQQQFVADSMDIEQAIQSKMNIYQNILYGARGLFASSNSVERSEWRTYFEETKMVQLYPGVQSFIYNPRIPADKLDAALLLASTTLNQSIKIDPPGPRAEYYPNYYVEPHDPANLATVGFDAITDPTRAAAMSLARDNNKTVITDELLLTADIKQGVSTPSFIMYLPLYKRGAPIETAEQRGAALNGYVSAGFHYKDFMDNLDIKINPNVDYEIFDGEISAEHQVYDSDDSGHGVDPNYHPLYSLERTIDIMGRKWIFHYSSLPGFGQGQIENYFPLAMAGISTLISLLLAGLIFFLANTQKRAMNLANAMTIQLRDSEERYRDLFQSSGDALMIIEPPKWNFTSANAATLKIFKIPDEQQFISLDPGKLSPEKQPDGQLSSVKAKAMIDQAMAKGSNFFEWTHRRFSGEPFPATVLLTKVQTKDKTFIQATVRDISGQKEAEIKLQERNQELERLNKLMVGRELKMAELKKEIENLKQPGK